jgi:hypothetical protein
MALQPAKLTAFIPAAETIPLFLDDKYLYENIWDSLKNGMAPLFERLNSPIYRNTWKGVMVSAPKNLLSLTNHLDNPNNVNASGSSQYRTVEVIGNLLEWSGRMSAEDATDLCNSYSTSAFNQLTQPLPTFNASPIAQAILSAHFLELRNSVSKKLWFSQSATYDTNTGASAAPFYRNFATSTLEEKAALQGMLWQKNGVTAQNGFWAQAYEHVQANEAAFLSTNTGVAGTNAARQSIVPTWFSGAFNKMPRKFLGRTADDATKAFFYVSRGMFEAYLDYLVSLNSAEGGWRLFQEGNSTWLTWKGYKVFCDEDSEAYDEETGAMITVTLDGKSSTFSRNLRALFTIPANYWLGADVPSNLTVDGLSVGPVGFIIQPGTTLQVDMGQVKWLAATCIGGAFKNPNALVVGYPTSQTWVS